MELELISYRGAEAGEANAHLVRCDQTSILLDCGSDRQGASYLADLRRPDAVWISHAHLDHCGALLELVARWPRMPLLATAKTAKLLEFSLSGAASTSARGEARVAALARKIKRVPWRRFRSIPGSDGARIMAIPAGHIAGAAMAVVEFGDGDEGRRVLYTGDFCTHDQAIVMGAGVPRMGGGFSIDAVISEAMLANDEEADAVDWDDEARALSDAVQEAPGAVLIGVASLGESVEVAAILADSGQSVMVDEYLRDVFKVCRADFGRRWEAITFGDRRRMAGRLRAKNVVIAPGDQFRRTTAAGVLSEPLVGDQSATLVVLNRARKNTAAGRLVAAGRGDEIRWRGRQVRCQAKVIYRRLVNHAPRWQLKGFIGGVDAPKTFLVHGPTGSRWALKRALAKDGHSGEVEVVESNEVFSF